VTLKQFDAETATVEHR